MSEPAQAAIGLEDPAVRGGQTGQPGQLGQNQPSQRESTFVDGSGPLFSLYLETATEEDKKMTDSWRADADGILIFTGLFSAAVAALVAVSVQDLKPNSQDISAFYLAKIYQLSAAANGSQVLVPSTLSDPSIPFSPPNSAVWVNSLWFLSLVISLTCALLATLLQQWARRYMKVTQKRYSPHKRARIRAFFAEGVDKLHLPWAVEALPALLHLSLFLFFAGLTVFLFNINHSVFRVAVSWIGVCMALYVCVTFMPIFRHDSPYYSPLSTSVWYLYAATLSAVFGSFRWRGLRDLISFSFYRRVRELQWAYQRWISHGMEKEAEEDALEMSSEIDGRALEWSFEFLDEDHELERFFAGIPGFLSSKVVDDPRSRLAKLDKKKVAGALTGFLGRTLSSDLLSEAIKKRRFLICVKAVDVFHLPGTASGIVQTMLQPEHTFLLRSEFGHSLLSWCNNDDKETSLCGDGIAAYLVANASQHEDHWFALTTHHLRISKSVVRDYLDHGDSVLLANLIHISGAIFPHLSRSDYVFLAAWTIADSILPLISNFSFENTLPGLQHDFCQLWNDVIQEARTTGDRYVLRVLRPIRHLYLALHQGTDAAPTTFSASTSDDDPILFEVSSYPLCHIPSHRRDPPSKPDEVEDANTVEMTHTPTPTSSPLPHSDAGLFVVPPVANSEAYHSPMPSVNRTIPFPVDKQSQNEASSTLQAIAPVVLPSHSTASEDHRSPDIVTTNIIQGITDPKPSIDSSIVKSASRFISIGDGGRDAAALGIANTTITIPPTNPGAIPSHDPSLTMSSIDPAAFQVPPDPTLNVSGHARYRGLTSPPLSQIASSSILDSRVNTDPESILRIQERDEPDNTLDSNCHIASLFDASSSPEIAEDSLPPGNHDPSLDV